MASPTLLQNIQASLALTDYIPFNGIYPSQGGAGDSFFDLGNIGIFAGPFLPAQRPTDGSILPIASNTAIFSLLGTTSGGNGTTNFAVPDLGGTVMVGSGQGAGLSTEVVGQTSGSTTAAAAPIAGGGQQTIDNHQPSLGVTYLIAADGIFPSLGAGSAALDTLGMVEPFAGNFVPSGYLPADGQLLSIAQNTALFSVLGTTYGGNGTTNFALPDLQGRAIVGASNDTLLGSVIGQSGATLTNTPGQTFDNRQPSLALEYLIATTGVFPPGDGSGSQPTNTPAQSPFLGQVIAFAGDFVPSGWARADGSLLSIAQNTALFSVLGTTYGGNGTTTFALPDLEDKVVIGADSSLPAGTEVGANSEAQPTFPFITGETSASLDGTDISVGKTVTFALTMSEPVVVTEGGTAPTLQLDDGQVAGYSGAVGSSVGALAFSYTVQATDTAADLHATAFNPLAAGTTIANTSGNSAYLAGFTPIDAGVQVDTTPPAAPTVALAHDTGFSSTDGITSDPTIVATPSGSGDTLLYKIDAAGSFSTTVPAFATDGTADGSHTVSVEEEDAAGNISPAASLTFVLDTRVPAAPAVALTHDTGASASDGITSDASLTVTPATAGDILAYRVDGTSVASYAPASLADGPHTVAVDETGPSGLTSSATAIAFTLDRVAPTVTLALPTTLTNVAALPVSGTVDAADAGTAVSITGTGGSSAAGTGIVQAGGGYTSVAPLVHGANVLTASDTDLAGNVGTSASAGVTEINVTDATLQAVTALVGQMPVVADLTNPRTATASPGTTLLVVNASNDAPGLDALTPDGNGALAASNGAATTLSNPTGTPITVLSETSSFLELAAGAFTALGGDARTFVADASHDAAAVTLMAGSGRSFLLGGQGSTMLVGSTATTGSATLLAESGASTVQGGAGTDRLVGTSAGDALRGGSGAGQLLSGFGGGETLTAGSGTGQVLAVDSGSNTLDASRGGTGDILWSGSGSDTMLGSAQGTSFVLGREVGGLAQGAATATGGSGNDVFFVQQGNAQSYDKIVGGGGADVALFKGYAAADATVTNDTSTQTTHIAFASGQTADVSGHVTIIIGGSSFVSA